MVRKAKKSKAKKLAKRSVKKTKRAPAKKGKTQKAPLKSAASPLENIPYMLGYAFYSRPSGR
jgi:hypothetical protein